MIQTDKKFYSLKKEPNTLLVLIAKMNEGTYGFLKLWPLPHAKPKVMELYYFGPMSKVTKVDVKEFESNMSLHKERRHVLIETLWSLKW